MKKLLIIALFLIGCGTDKIVYTNEFEHQKIITMDEVCSVEEYYFHPGFTPERYEIWRIDNEILTPVPQHFNTNRGWPFSCNESANYTWIIYY